MLILQYFDAWNDWIECCMHVSKWSWLFGCWLLYRLLCDVPEPPGHGWLTTAVVGPRQINQAAVRATRPSPLWTAGAWYYRRLCGLSTITLVSSYSPFIVDTVQQLITTSIRLCWWQPGAPSILTFNIANNVLFIPIPPPPDITVPLWHFPADIILFTLVATWRPIVTDISSIYSSISSVGGNLTLQHYAHNSFVSIVP